MDDEARGKGRSERTPTVDNGWSEQIAQYEAEAEEMFVPGMTMAPHGGETSDLNLHLHDLLAGPNPNVPDIGEPAEGGQR